MLLILRLRIFVCLWLPPAFLQYMVMPFGVHNALAVVQRLVNPMLSIFSGGEVLLRDSEVYSNSWHDQFSSRVFRRLCNANLMPNLAKFAFGQATLTYLGKNVGQGQLKPAHSKVDAILSFLAPVSWCELCALGGWRNTREAFVKTSLLLLVHSLTS